MTSGKSRLHSDGHRFAAGGSSHKADPASATIAHPYSFLLGNNGQGSPGLTLAGSQGTDQAATGNGIAGLGQAGVPGSNGVAPAVPAVVGFAAAEAPVAAASAQSATGGSGVGLAAIVSAKLAAGTETTKGHAVGVAPVNRMAAGNDTGGASALGGSLLPAGYLSTSGNQIVDAEGNPVRIASIGWSGTDSLTFAPYGLWQSSMQQNIDAIKADGFNTIRVPWTDLLLNASPEESSSYAAINPALDPELVGATSLQLLDQLVADAGKDGLKIIFDHHDDDGGPNGGGGQQANGLWIDSGPGTNGTDGSGHTGTVDAAKFLSDSVALAQNFAGNSTVIGFDLDNEPTVKGNINWGQGGPTDIHAMYTSVGDAIQAVDPGALIIAEGPEEWSGPAAGMPAGFAEGDLSGVASDPVSLNIANKVVYSVHEYPPDISGNGSYNNATQVAAMNAGWGYLETDNIAPVWVGEMGSNMTSSQDSTWIQGILNYMNGDDGAAGGPTFSGSQQPVSGSWWQWGQASGQDPQGVETAWGSGTYWSAQQTATDQLLYKPSGAAAPASAATTATPLSALATTTKMPFLSMASGAVALTSAGSVELATVMNVGSAAATGWAIELDSAAVLSGLAGAVVTTEKPGVYLVTPTASDANLAAGGFVTVSVQSPTSIPSITAHVV